MKKIICSLLMVFTILFISSCDNSNSNSNSGGSNVSSDNSKTVETVTEKKYSISIQSSENGYVSVNKTEANDGDAIVVTVHPSSNYALNTSKLYYTGYGSDYQYKISNNTFKMPKFNIKLYATFEKAYTVTFVINGSEKYEEKVIEGKTPYKYVNDISNQYHWLSVYTNPACTIRYTSTAIKSDTTLYVVRKLNPYKIVSNNKATQKYSSTYENNDILNNVITEASCNYNSPAYLKIHLTKGQIAIVTTDTTNLHMSTLLMLSLAGDKGEALNGGKFTTFVRSEDSAEHSLLILSVTQTGDYYIAVTYSPEAVSKYGVSYLKTFDYKFDVTAVINNNILI